MLPPAIANAVRLPKLEPADFKATKWDTAEVKVKFGNHLLRFIAEDYPKFLWTNVFYNRLALTFSNIAHYNSHGFWITFFESTTDHIQFLRNIARHPCWGDPEFTYSDIERAVRARVIKSGIIPWKERILAEERKNMDLRELARLKLLYEQSPARPADPLPAAPPQTMTQIDLFH